MHDLDRTLMELEAAADALASNDTALEAEDGDAGEWEGDYSGEFDQQYEDGLGEYEASDEEQEADDGEAPFDDAESMELAAELLETADDQEMEQFFGRLIRKAARAAGGIARSAAGKALGPVLTNLARTALPTIGAGLGNFVVPGLGGVAGGKLASAAGRMFGLELEGMSPEDQELEVAKRVVNLAGAAAQQVARAGTAGPPNVVAKNAVMMAARRHAPGLAGRRGARGIPPYGVPSTGARTGRWVRRGRRIIILGL
jgi:hypothetical protein